MSLFVCFLWLMRLFHLMKPGLWIQSVLYPDAVLLRGATTEVKNHCSCCSSDALALIRTSRHLSSYFSPPRCRSLLVGVKPTARCHSIYRSCVSTVQWPVWFHCRIAAQEAPASVFRRPAPLRWSPNTNWTRAEKHNLRRRSRLNQISMDLNSAIGSAQTLFIHSFI